MTRNYTRFAPVYDTAGFSDYAANVIPQLFNYVLQNGWMGRNVLVLGCGTGAGIAKLKDAGYGVAGVDSSPEMLQIARQRGFGSTPLHEQDIRQLQFNDEYDLAFAVNVLNELDTLRALEATFKGVHRALRTQQYFVFDFQTIEGLSKQNTTQRILYDSQDHLTIFAHNEYDYDRQMLTVRYVVFERTSGTWQRIDATQTLRSYPVQGVLGLLQRSGFEVVSVLTPSLAPYEPGVAGIGHLYVVAKKAD